MVNTGMKMIKNGKVMIMKYNNIWSVEVECYVKDLVLLIHNECPVIINEVEEKYRGKSKDVPMELLDKRVKLIDCHSNKIIIEV